MKHALSIPLLLLFLASAAFAADLVTIKDSEATNHIGERVEVRGYVAKVYTTGSGHTFIYLGKEGSTSFTGFTPKFSPLSSEKAFLKSLEGETIGIVGTIEFLKGEPWIWVRTKDQIKTKN
jgi:hypothetical protein